MSTNLTVRMLIAVTLLTRYVHCGYKNSKLLRTAIMKVPVIVYLGGENYTIGGTKAWSTIASGGSAVDAVEQGLSICEEKQCVKASMDENGEITRSALIMDGSDFNIGGVAGLRRMKSAIKVARKVLDNTEHSVLSGDLATEFALKLGLSEYNLESNITKKHQREWVKHKCQPNYWVNVKPNPKHDCGPYSTDKLKQNRTQSTTKKEKGTAGLITIDSKGRLAAGVTSTGINNQIPGRVGSSAIPGAGAYADSTIGGAVTSGDGDIMMWFPSSFLAVEELSRNATPKAAAETVINRIAGKFPAFFGGILVLRADGEYAVACHGYKNYSILVRNADTGKVLVESVQCLGNQKTKKSKT